MGRQIAAVVAAVGWAAFEVGWAELEVGWDALEVVVVVVDVVVAAACEGFHRIVVVAVAVAVAASALSRIAVVDAADVGTLAVVVGPVAGTHPVAGDTPVVAAVGSCANDQRGRDHEHLLLLAAPLQYSPVEFHH